MPRLLIDISNSFTKVARSEGEEITGVLRHPTSELDVPALRALSQQLGGNFTDVTVCSVVPRKTPVVNAAFDLPIVETSPQINLGIGICYPEPESIGPDRLANAVACSHLHGAPGIVVDFGTAVTFDVLSPQNEYIGGVIAPGLSAMTDYLHEKTALLPRIEPVEPKRAVGKSTREAMLAGTVYGYRGLIREILTCICLEEFPSGRPKVVATGGYAELIASGLELFDDVNPLLTLHGLRLIAERNHAT